MNMKPQSMNIIACLVCIISSSVSGAVAQNTTDEVLRQIEMNNPQLKAAAAEAEAEKLANRSGAVLDNPEIEFNYLWGADGIGNRRDFRVTQAFDIPTLTGMKSRQVAGQNELASLRYKAERIDVLLQARQTCIELVHCNALKSELSSHLEQARALVGFYEKRLKAGDATILDLNKAKVHLTAVRGQISKVDVERESLLATLRILNGGNEISFDETSYDISEALPADFETWYSNASEKNPVLQYVRQEVAVGKRQLAIDKTSWLPELTVGYMSELASDKYRGVTVGVSIPLWSNAVKVKQSRARIAAAESQKAQAEQKFYYEIMAQYARAANLKENSELMRASLEETDNREHLLAAQSKGEISMIEYLVEIDQYYEAIEQTLEAERDYRLALAQLKVLE